MKIGFAIGTLNYSGAEKIARYLIEALYKQNHEVGIILLGGVGPYEDFSYCKQFVIKTEGNRYLRTYKRQRIIRGIVKNECYDVIVSFGVKFNLDVMEALHFSKTSVILCERNDPVSDPHRKVLRIRRKLIYKKADGFVFQTERIAEFFGEKLAKRGTVIPNFIEERLPYLYNANAENNIVLTARLDDVQKNISMLLRAFKTFSATHDYKLYLVGDGPDEQKFKNYVNENNLSDRVIFTGRQNSYDYLKIAKIFVLPSHYEGMPNSLIEALATGIPSISTDCSGGGASYLIQDHVNGTLIPIDGENELVAALAELADNGELREQYSREAYKLNDRLEFNKILSMWISYIEKIARK